MKTSHIIPPAAALLGVVFWNVWQSQAVSTESARVRVLRERVEAAGASTASDHPATGGSRIPKQKNKTANEPIDWKNLSARMVAMEKKSGGVGDVRAMLDLQKRAAGMSKEEIIAALDEISSLGLDPDAKAALEDVLAASLIENDPKLALATFADRIPNEDDGVGWQLSGALRDWAKKDPLAAAAWFDQQISAGLFESKTLDGQSQARMEFEAALVGVLLDSDAAAASQRIAGLPEDQRRETLEQISFSELSLAAQRAYAALVRGLVPQDERAGSFTHVISELIPEGGYEKVGGFLDDIQATPQERAVSAREAANTQLEQIAGEREVTREDVEAMRAWLKLQAPGTEDRVTGEALADAAQEGGEFGFDEASKLALDYHKSSGNDDVLVAFLESFAARSNLDEALSLANHIKDPARRDEILNRFK